MEKVVLFWVAVCATLALAAASGSVCEGIWKLDKVEKCPDHEQYPIDFEITKRKLNRYTDCFTMVIQFPEDFGPEYQVRMESFEKCDGGYKASDVLAGSACDLLNQFAKENFHDMLEQAGIETRDCPIPKGNYEIKDYVINYESLPEQGKCGDYKWIVYVIKNGQKQACIISYSTFVPKEEEEDES